MRRGDAEKAEDHGQLVRDTGEVRGRRRKRGCSGRHARGHRPRRPLLQLLDPPRQMLDMGQERKDEGEIGTAQPAMGTVLVDLLAAIGAIHMLRDRESLAAACCTATIADVPGGGNKLIAAPMMPRAVRPSGRIFRLCLAGRARLRSRNNNHIALGGIAMKVVGCTEKRCALGLLALAALALWSRAAAAEDIKIGQLKTAGNGATFVALERGY